jgi:hypothetical protein
MADMPPMLAYTIQGSMYPTLAPRITIGQGPSKQDLTPKTPSDDSYWIVILDATTRGTESRSSSFPVRTTPRSPAVSIST